MEQRVKICIVEDEVIIADLLRMNLQSLGYDVPMPSANYDEAIEMLDREQPDLALMDIKLIRSKDGIEIAKYVRQHFDMPIIFLTANSDKETLERAKQVKPDAFLIKPFQKPDLYAAIEIAISNHSAVQPVAGKKQKEEQYLAKDAIFIKDGYYFNKVKFDDIIFLSSENVYVTVHTMQKKYLVRASLQDYLGKFDLNKFVRVHQRYAVNIDKVDKINSAYLMIGSEEIPVSKSYHHLLLAGLNIG